MNNNPQPCDNRREKQMNAITKAMNRPDWMAAPDYRRLLTTLRHEEPDRVPREGRRS